MEEYSTVGRISSSQDREKRCQAPAPVVQSLREASTCKSVGGREGECCPELPGGKCRSGEGE